MNNNNDALMSVGELARRVGVTVRTVQYYDQKGLLHPSGKGEQGQRLYSAEDEERLYRILTLKYLGFSLGQIKEGEGSDASAELTRALKRRSLELERENVEILRAINTVHTLQNHLEDGEGLCWSDFASDISSVQDREEVLWQAINGEALEGEPVPDLSRAEIIEWHKLMGATIEAMHDGVCPEDARAQELAERFRKLGGMPHALAGLMRLANQRSNGPKQYGRDFYAGIQRRTLDFLADALAIAEGDRKAACAVSKSDVANTSEPVSEAGEKAR